MISKIPKGIQIEEKNTDFIGWSSTEVLNKKVLLRDKFIILEAKNCSSNLKPYLILRANENKIYVIGRSEQADIKLNQPEISREHSNIFYSHNKWFIRDCGSQNGTWFNINQRWKGKSKSKKFILMKGDSFKVSDSIFTLK